MWGAIGGIPGLLGYRAVNTLDAMIGYRDALPRFGWAAARTDDPANLLPGTAERRPDRGLAPLVGGTRGGVARLAP